MGIWVLADDVVEIEGISEEADNRADDEDRVLVDHGLDLRPLDE